LVGVTTISKFQIRISCLVLEKHLLLLSNYNTPRRSQSLMISFFERTAKKNDECGGEFSLKYHMNFFLRAEKNQRDDCSTPRRSLHFSSQYQQTVQKYSAVVREIGQHQ
jgi:hypothetical protein